MKYIYSTSQMSKLSLTLCTFSVTSSVAGLFLTVSFVEFVIVLLPWKYFEIVLTSFLDLAGSVGGGGAFLIEIGTSSEVSLLVLFLLGATLGMNLEEIFILRVVALLLV